MDVDDADDDDDNDNDDKRHTSLLLALYCLIVFSWTFPITASAT